jgi:ubiquinone/menaquinone biosynthesis C-methylase UbiE
MADWNLFWSKRTTKEKLLNLGGISFNRAFARHISHNLGPPHSSGMVLEVGTGRGVCSVTLKEMGYHCISIDSSDVAVELARGKQLELILCDGCHLPFSQKAFEVVFTQGLLEHLPFDAQVAILAETQRVARLAIHSVPAKHGVMDIGERVFNRLGKVWPYPDEKKFEKSEFEQLLATTFHKVKIAGFLKVDWIAYCQ